MNFLRNENGKERNRVSQDIRWFTDLSNAFPVRRSKVQPGEIEEGENQLQPCFYALLGFLQSKL
jgi:hypothetical protein